MPDCAAIAAAIAAARKLKESAPVEDTVASIAQESNAFEKFAWVGIAPIVALIILFLVWPHEGTATAVDDKLKPS